MPTLVIRKGESHERVRLMYLSSLQLISRDSPTLWRAICFTQYTEWYVYLIQKKLSQKYPEILTKF